ncbi:MAG: ferrochelatase [Acidobacteriaceae bacterium]|nr:ferrochelatase [Acidobacteriaceae bacterium]
MYDALLIVSFGGPERREDVLPFLENVTRGRNVPRERLLEVAEHYYQLGGKSPINDHCRELIAKLRNELTLPIYWGNRNWHPFLLDTLQQMRGDGIQHAVAFVTSAYSSYSGCRQYRENIAAAQNVLGQGAPKIDKLPVFYNHPGFIRACVDRVREALGRFLPNKANLPNPPIRLVISAHSIPVWMAAGSAYERQLRETARLVAEAVGFSEWDLVFQSRSGPPSQPWLGPDILDHLRKLRSDGVENVLVAPLGFVSDHVEVLYDLDTEAQNLAKELGINMVRAATAGTHPAFVGMIREMVEERILRNEPITSDACPQDCCPAPQPGAQKPADRSPVLAVRTGVPQS